MKFIAIIPARYASTRFPAKPLAMLGGKRVIERVYEQVAGVLAGNGYKVVELSVGYDGWVKAGGATVK